MIDVTNWNLTKEQKKELDEAIKVYEKMAERKARKHEREKIKEACDVRKELNYKELSEAYKTGWASAIEKVMKECGKRK